MSKNLISIILPAKNEANSLSKLLPELIALKFFHEIIVVDDGSTDNTIDVCKNHNIVLISHPYSKGNGAAIKTGAKAASGDIFVFMDADGQHNPKDIHQLLTKFHEGYDLVVAARSDNAHASLRRRLANGCYNKFSSWIVGHEILDLTSGFRVFRAELFKKILYMLPNGFSYPTTSTIAFFRSGYSVAYLPIQVLQREDKSKSHINILKDGLRFLLIIFKVGTLYSPLKLFTPISGIFFLTGFTYYIYTYFLFGRFTNMSALLFITSLLFFFMGLISEQISNLQYMKEEQTNKKNES